MSQTSFDVEALCAAVQRAAAAAISTAATLNAQDAKMGDGDLGITVASGYGELEKQVASFQEDLGLALLQCAKVFQQTSASSYGTLTATAFMAAGRFAKGRTEIPWSELGTLLELARDAMMARGKGSLGDKSVLDILDHVAQAVKGMDDPAMIRAAAHLAASESLDEFRERPCRLGRARAHGNASIGTDDPGMLAMWHLIHAL
jgi:dihydroxyacetone kinase-like protein